MKLAIVIALASDRRSGRVLTNVMPSDKAITLVKAALTDGECPDARFPILRAISIDSSLREHRFRVTPQEIADAEDDDVVLKPADQKMITVELGPDEDKTVINVQTEAEAKFIRELAASIGNKEPVLIPIEIGEDEDKIVFNVASEADAETARYLCGGLKRLTGQLAETIGELKVNEDTLKVANQRIAELEVQLNTNAKAPDLALDAAPGATPATPATAAKKAK